MASSAGIYGHTGLSAAARAMEQLFDQSVIGVAEQRVSLFRLLNEAERVLADSKGVSGPAAVKPPSF
jgi:hypothetical protein